MIDVKYCGRSGNHLFQYCFGRVLAHRLGYELKAAPLAGFPNTAEKVPGKNFSNGPVQTLQLHEVDVEGLVRDPSERRILLDGFFQRYEYYRDYKDKIRQWLKTEPLADFHPDPEDIVVYVRKKDYVEARSMLPFSFYEEALSRAKYKRVFVCTDDPHDGFMKRFKKYGAVIRNTPDDPMADFRFILSFNKIVQSASSFSWWASFLSDAKEIYTPIPLEGYWSAEMPDMNLKVDDESRYIYIRCRETYRRTLPEEWMMLRKKIQPRLEHMRHVAHDRLRTKYQHVRHKASLVKKRLKNKLTRIANFQADHVSGEKFKEIADFSYQPGASIPSSARLLFCETHYLEPLFREIAGRKNKYVLISHNSDNELTEALVKLLPDNVVRWFAQNADVEHPRIEGLPIGIANSGWDHGDFGRLKRIARQRLPQKNLAYLCASISTKSDVRQKVYEKFKDSPFVTVRGGENFILIDEFLSDIASHPFTLSPRGNGVDCHRTWEALYLGSYPVIEKSAAMRYFKDLPIVYVDSMDEVSEGMLRERYEKMSREPRNLQSLSMSYWKKRIRSFL